MTAKTKNILIHAGIIIAFLVLSCVYFSPIVGGQALPQGDIQKYESMAKAQKDYHKATGDYTTWCPSMFSGMPGYQITNSPQHSVFWPLRQASSLSFMGWGNTIGVLFLYLVGFYIALIAMGLSPWLALIGSLAFGFGSYNIIIVEAGHITKAWAMAMVAPILAGMILAFRKKYVWGGILFFLALGLQIQFNHIQITFYTVLGALVLGVVYMLYAIKDKEFKPFFTAVGVLLLGCLLAFACNYRHLMINQEYAKATMRGGKEITVTPKDLDPNAQVADDGTTTKGLDINYAFSWSYGVGETYTLLVPGAMGGGSGEKVGEDSEFFRTFRTDQAPLYWGNQPFTSGPVYFGAIICFLFILGLFVVKGPERWWLLVATILAIVMSWGRNAIGFNGFLFEHLPLYNKFRTPSMSLILANVTMVMMAVLAVHSILQAKDNGVERKKLNLYVAISGGITVVVILAGIFMCSGFSFSGSSDVEMANQYKDQWPIIQRALQADRLSLFKDDSWRSILFVLLAAATLCLGINLKNSKKWVVAVLLGVFICVDLIGVDNRYLYEKKYVRSERMLEQQPQEYELQIDQMAAQMGLKNYRIMDMSVNTYNDSRPSAFHNQIGGYSAAKLRRYQDLIDFYLGQNMVFNHYMKNAQAGNPTFDNYPVLDMLNCRFIVAPGQDGRPQIAPRQSALGNAWFVKNVRLVDDANGEILALNDFNPAVTAVVNKEYAGLVSAFDKPADSLATASTIVMEESAPANPNLCKYNVHCAKEELAVFSEIYYEPDWKAYIDGKPADYFRANYVLRAMVIPAGDHVVEFRNEAPTMHRLDTLTLIFSIVSMLIVAGTLVIYYRKKSQLQTKA